MPCVVENTTKESASGHAVPTHIGPSGHRGRSSLGFQGNAGVD